jgi:iron complex transport system substrate-binding protein
VLLTVVLWTGNVLNRKLFLKLMAAGAATVSTGLLTGCESLEEFLSGVQTITDDAGREVTLPAPHLLEKIYFTSSLAQIFCFTVAPDLLAGTTVLFTSDQLAYLPDSMSELSYLGSLSAGAAIDTEALEYLGVQVLFSISGTDLTDVNVNDALRLQTTTGIPVVLIDGSFDVIGDTYRLLGHCLGREERANQLADYCAEIYERVTAAIATVPESARVTYYFAEGPEGLQTEPNASQHSLAFTTAGGINVAAKLDYVVGSQVMADTTIEEIVGWDPQYIISWDYETRSGASKVIQNSSEWAGIDAVRNGRVFEMPALPYAFCDRPPGMNRFLGIQWLANLFYPGYYDVDMVDVVREFYARCYWRDITADQARSILGTSYGG